MLTNKPKLKNILKELLEAEAPKEIFYEIGKYLDANELCAHRATYKKGKFELFNLFENNYQETRITTLATKVLNFVLKEDKGKDEDAFTLLKNEPKLVFPCLQLFVAYGQQKAASRILTDYPELAFKKGKFTDSANRTFDCSAYRYTQWVKDIPMLKMIKSCVLQSKEAKNLVYEVLKQLEFQSQSLIYTKNKKTIESKHFNLKPLQNAYQVNSNCINSIPPIIPPI
jgi:hypothetical protein